MKLCKVVGKCWSTVKEEKLEGTRFLIARELTSSGKLKEEFITAADDLGAAVDDIVLISSGEAVYRSSGGNKPVDSIIIAIVEGYSVKDN
jgi:microcompartment protein CcmK/EutM